MTTAATALDLRELTDDALAALYGSTDETARAAALAEAERRDRAAQAKRARNADRDAWADAKHADYLAAVKATNGNLLSREGITAGVDEQSLWTGPEAQARRYASEEMLAEWEIRPRRTVTDFRDGLAADRRAEREAALSPSWGAPAVTPADIRTYSSIEPAETVWLWEKRIPRGEVTLIAGEGGVSKGQLLIDLAARVTTGRPMPTSETPTTPGSVILITPEDDLSETVAWRLRAAGADLSRVHDLTYLGLGAPFELSATEKREGNIAQLREAVDAIGDVKLVIIDPLMACIAYGTVATNLGARRVLAPLQRLARETGAAVVISHHTVKSGAIAGSKGLIDTARVVYRIRKDPENAAVRVMTLEKSNVLGSTEDVRYVIAGDGHGAHVSWLSRDELAARRTAWRDREAPTAAAAGTGTESSRALLEQARQRHGLRLRSRSARSTP